MRHLLLALLSLLVADFALADDYYTRPHVRRDGTYVQGHRSTDPNSHRFDNYSSRGNVNPYTGQTGSQRNEFTSPPAYNTGRRQQPDSFNSNPYSNPYGNPYGNSRSRGY